MLTDSQEQQSTELRQSDGDEDAGERAQPRSGAGAAQVAEVVAAPAGRPVVGAVDRVRVGRVRWRRRPGLSDRRAQEAPEQPPVCTGEQRGLLVAAARRRDAQLCGRNEKKNWCIPFGTQRVETEGVSKSEDIEINPKADSHPGTNQA